MFHENLEIITSIIVIVFTCLRLAATCDDRSRLPAPKFITQSASNENKFPWKDRKYASQSSRNHQENVTAAGAAAAPIYTDLQMSQIKWATHTHIHTHEHEHRRSHARRTFKIMIDADYVVYKNRCVRS